MACYELKCSGCEKMVEIITKYSDLKKNKFKCPKCDKELELQISKSSFILKGAGFHKNDYKKTVDK